MVNPKKFEQHAGQSGLNQRASPLQQLQWPRCRCRAHLGPRLFTVLEPKGCSSIGVLVAGHLDALHANKVLQVTITIWSAIESGSSGVARWEDMLWRSQLGRMLRQPSDARLVRRCRVRHRRSLVRYALRVR